jgi:triosephosphate isomerase
VFNGKRAIKIELLIYYTKLNFVLYAKSLIFEASINIITMRQYIVAGNWKMNKSLEDGLKLASEVINIANDEVKSNVNIVLCPPFTHLTSVKKLIGDSKNIFLGAQNVSNKKSGAYTGEISVEMLKSVGVDYVIIGHSERREYFNESNEMLAEKTNLVLEAGMVPIFCMGETLAQREQGIHIDFVKSQITDSLFHLVDTAFRKVVLAYEPIWAIGTGVTASSEQAQEMHLMIRNHIASKYGQATADAITIQYGGSCKASNAVELFDCPDIDGGLIGGAALVAREFVEVVKAAK